MNETQPALFELPPRIKRLLRSAGYEAKLAILSRVDGRPLGAYDRKALKALLSVMDLEKPEPGEVQASDAFVRTPDGGLDWSPEAKPIVEASAKPTRKPRKRAPR